MKNIVRFSGILAFVAASVFFTTTLSAHPTVRGVIIKNIKNNSSKKDIKPGNAQPNKTQPEVDLGAPVNPNNGKR